MSCEISLGPLIINVVSRISDSSDYWDANWVVVDICYSLKGMIDVTINGTQIHLSDLNLWLVQLLNLDQTLIGNADLNCMDENLTIKMSINKTGNLKVEVTIRNQPYIDQCRFTFDSDQSQIRPLIASLNRMFEEFPLRGTR